MEDELKFYTVEEIAEGLNVSKRTLYRFIQSGQLHAVKIGQNWRISKKDFEDFIAAQEQT